MRTLGNIRLIAELFNKGIVAERIVTVCITELIGDLKSDPIEDNVEVNLLAMSCSAYGTTPQSCQEALQQQTALPEVQSRTAKLEMASINETSFALNLSDVF